ncbi:MAG: 50S ribosomal protein L10 [Gemmatimonadetes bacterium]|nr:50S ribosomal protein L10 [Gemmatimonadota bacterium]
MATAEKKKIVTGLGARLSGVKCLYLADFTGLGVAEITDLRRRLSEADVEFVVVKNTLAKRALEDTPYAALAEYLEGPNAFAFSTEDVVSPAKVLTDFAKASDRPQIKAGAIEGQVVSLEEIRRIAKLPAREALLGQIVGYARAPIAGLVYTLNGLLSQFVRTMDAMRAQREQSEPAPTEQAATVEEETPVEEVAVAEQEVPAEEEGTPPADVEQPDPES